MNIKKKSKLNQELIELSNKNNIASIVAQEALDYSGGDQIAFFEDLLQHGCQSGMVSLLIYYSDTHQFYDDHYDEIEELRFEYEEEFGILINVDGDLKNWFAWFSFVEVAKKMAENYQCI